MLQGAGGGVGVGGGGGWGGGGAPHEVCNRVMLPELQKIVAQPLPPTSPNVTPSP